MEKIDVQVQIYALIPICGHKRANTHTHVNLDEMSVKQGF